MCSSHRRRAARRFCYGALKEFSRHWWSGPVPFGDCNVMKAVHTAERSGRANRRRKRGLRIGKARSREYHSRRSPRVRQPLPKEISSRQVTKFTQLDFWAGRRAGFIERIGPRVSKDYQLGGGSDSTRVSRRAGSGLKNRHLNFDYISYRRDRAQYESLLSHARKVKVCRPAFTRWLVFLDTHFRYSPPGVLPATQYLEDAILFSKDAVFDHLKPVKKTAGPSVKHSDVKGRRGSGSSSRKNSGSSQSGSSRFRDLF
jgi:hypothetical protein